MNPDELAHFKKLLVAMRDDTINTGDLAIEPSQQDNVERPDADDDLPLAQMNQVIASQRNKSRTVSLQRVLAALRRLEEYPEDFGYCLECDQLIPKRRLELMPYATMCVACQSELEAARKRGGRRSLTDFD